MWEVYVDDTVIIPFDMPNVKVATEFPSTSSLSVAHVPELQVVK